jgi:hypothetical protein
MPVFPFFEIAYATALCALFFLAYSAAQGPREIRLAFTWLLLFFLAGIFRALLELCPALAPVISGALVGVSVGAMLALRAVRPTRAPGLKAADAYWVGLLVFLGARSFFPSFDVDSLLYHLNGVRYLAMRHELPPYQQNLEVASLWNNWMGFEESLLTPVARLDLGLAGGLVGGAFKIFSMFTVVALIPAPAFLLRTLAVFLILIDDHFFFSGQSRLVYLNTSLIGLVSLSFWLAARSWRRPERFSLPAILVGVIGAAVKTHGLFFFAPVLGVAVLACVRKRVPPRKLLGERLARLCLAFALTGFSAFFLMKWLVTGSPLAPFDFLFWKADHRWREPNTLLALRAKTSWASLKVMPWVPLVYPGNLAMKAVAVLILPAGLAQLFRRWRSARLAYAVFFFAVTAGWAFTSRYLNVEESRYPRYVFGVAVLGLCMFGLHAWRLREARILRGPLRRWLVPASHCLALLLCLRLVLTIDTRYFNVPTGERPKWANIFSFVEGLGTRSSLSPRSPHMASLYLPFMYTDVAPLEACVEKLPEAATLQTGAGLIIFGPFSTWPLILLSPGAVAGSSWEGGGNLRQVEGGAELKARGIKFALVPRDPTFPVQARNRADELVPLEMKGKDICEGRGTVLRRLE